jgi:nucleotide-binding universal stress UspA family protein
MAPSSQGSYLSHAAQEGAIMQTSSAVSPRDAEFDSQRESKHVIACIDSSKHARKIISHATAVAGALRLPVTLFQVLEAPPTKAARPDPIEWDIRRHESRSALKRLSEAGANGVDAINAELVEGQTAEEICRRAQAGAAELLVLGTHGEREAGGIGSTARHVLEKAPGAVLLVPVSTASVRTPGYRRILVPLDGSSWSESVLPLAVRLARAADAEIILVHVIPAPELIETDPLEAEDIELRDRLIDRNERVARSYLDRVRRYAAEPGLKVRALTLRGDDIRSSLTRFTGSENVDLVVLSTRGHGGTRVSDVPYGNVAGYLITHSPVPVLIVRPTGLSGNIHTTAKRETARPSVGLAV